MEASAVEIDVNETDRTRIRRYGETNQVRAASLLDAWIAGDRQRLDYELNEWREGDLAMEGEGDDSREELLLCVVRQMMDEPDLYASRSEKLHLGVWIDILTRLAGHEDTLR
jgi:hypothetical protein